MMTSSQLVATSLLKFKLNFTLEVTSIIQPCSLTLIDPSQYQNAQYILLDPPCSGSGMTSRLNIFGDSAGMRGSDNPERLLQLAGLQSKMLVFALQNFPNAKKLVYSTCSINVEENEQVIRNARLGAHFKTP